MKKAVTKYWIALILAVAAGNALAQSDDDVTIDQLREELAKRDKIIIDLQHRVEALEQKMTAENNEAAMQGSAPDGATTSEQRGSGMEIDELAAERALERSLVQEGVRLLRPGEVEIDLGATYSRNETATPTITTITGNRFVAEVARQADLFDATAGFRFGLPFETQLEVSVPYRDIGVDTALRIDGAVESTAHRSGSGGGDVRVSLVKQLMQEKSRRPNLIGRVEWLTGSGDDEDNGLSLGGGNEGFGAQLSASWRRDPLVFLLGGGYTHYVDSGRSYLQPGDSIDLSLGTALALSPETALTFSLNQSFSKAFTLDGAELPGSDRQSSVFNMSVSTTLGRGVLLRVNTGIGLTEDAPDYQLGVSVPIRANLFGH